MGTCKGSLGFSLLTADLTMTIKKMVGDSATVLVESTGENKRTKCKRREGYLRPNRNLTKGGEIKTYGDSGT